MPVLMAVFEHFTAAREKDEVIEMSLEALHRLCDHGMLVDLNAFCYSFFPFVLPLPLLVLT